MPTPPVKHAIEARDSFSSYLERTKAQGDESGENVRRGLKHHANDIELLELERKQEILDQEDKMQQARIEKALLKHEKKKAVLLKDSGIQDDTVHGMMIDAGSGGSRMHVFEWSPRVLQNPRDVAAAVAGKKLTYPGSDSRWTDRLSPGLSTFATKPDDQLVDVSAPLLV